MKPSVDSPSGAQVQEEKPPYEDRLTMLCDGVFAIAITLLVLDIKVSPLPANADIHNTQILDIVHTNMAEVISKITTYLITFAIIAAYWIGHRRMMLHIKRLDGPFIWLTFLFLAFIVFFPVAYGIITEYGKFSEAVIFFTLVMAGCGFASQILWLYASWNRRLIDVDAESVTVTSRLIRSIVVPTYFCLSLLLLLIPYFHDHPSDIYYSWLLLPVFAIISQRVSKLLAKRSQTPDQLSAADH